MNTKRLSDEQFNSFFAGYVVIKPNGKRRFCSSYLDYCNTVLYFIDDEDQKVARTNYATFAAVEEEVEDRFKLPAEHLLGATEVFTNLPQILGIAKFESDRFKQNKSNKAPDNQTHLDLFLVTSLQPGQVPDCDIVRRIRKEERDNCTCLRCWPSSTSESLWVLNESELENIHKLLHISSIPINVYIPFRRQCVRSNAQEPLPTREVKGAI